MSIKTAKEIRDKIKEILKTPLVTFEDLETWANSEYDGHVDYDFSDVLKASTPKALNEASLGRIHQHVSRSGKTSWAILTSWRQDVSLETNKRNLKELKDRLKRWGYFPIAGHGQEEDPDGKLVAVSEPAFFVVGIPLEDALELARKYNQWGIIFAGAEMDENICLVREDGTVEKRMTKFHPGKIAQFYSAVRGRPFVFESLAVGWTEGYARQQCGMTSISGIPKRQSWSGVEWETSEEG